MKKAVVKRPGDITKQLDAKVRRTSKYLTSVKTVLRR